MTRNVNDLAAMERLLEADVAIVTRDNGGTIDRIHQTVTDGEYAVIREEASVSLANTIVDVDAAIERLRPGPGRRDEMSDWIVKVTGAKIPGSVRSPYSIVRVLEVTTGVTSCRAKDVIRIVYESAPVPAGGTTARSGYQKKIAYARDLIARRTEIEARERIAEVARQAALTAAVAAKLECGEQISAADLAGIRPL